MSDQFVIPNGLEEIKKDLSYIVEVIGNAARWVHPNTFKALPVWCPDTARGRARYDAQWSKQLESGRGRLKLEENIRAANALTEALGVKGKKPRNWTVCHIWGYDDEAFTSQGRIVRDPLYYSCIGNMVWLPTPLKGFTDAVPEIKSMLRCCAYHLYGWACEHPDVKVDAERISNGYMPDIYPASWPTAAHPTYPRGTAPYSATVISNIERRKAQIKQRMADASLVNYPRDEVKRVLEHWKITL
jgi:hypothetical protein